MTYAHTDLHTPLTRLPSLPGWISPVGMETAEEAAFLSGAALGHLHHVLQAPEVPLTLIRARLALRAAEVCVALSGRSERAADLRDELHLLRPGDTPGPAGAMSVQWQDAVVRPLSVGTLAKALPQITAEEIGDFLDTEHRSGQGAPIARAATVLERVLIAYPQDEVMAAILADSTLAQALGWDHIVPLLGVGLALGDWRAAGDDLRLACHRAVVSSVHELHPLAADLARRAARLRAVAPKLRAKGAEAAVHLFLTRDAVTPAGLANGTCLSDRGARRFCERLVGLGVARELTGRDTFRIYGI